MCGRHKDPGGEDGGRTHEVGLATGLSEEQGGQPGEAAIVRGRGSFTVLVRPDYTASPGALVGSEEWFITNYVKESLLFIDKSRLLLIIYC